MIWPGSPDSCSAPAYNPGQLKGARIEVKIHKILFDLMWRVARSGPLDFTGQPGGKWELKACVRTSYAADVCAAPVFFTVNPLAETGGGNDTPGIGGELGAAPPPVVTPQGR